MPPTFTSQGRFHILPHGANLPSVVTVTTLHGINLPLASFEIANTKLLKLIPDALSEEI